MSEPANASEEHPPDETIRRRHTGDPAANARALDALSRVQRGEPPSDVIEPDELERFLREQRQR
jgi:hypothetical protein